MREAEFDSEHMSAEFFALFGGHWSHDGPECHRPTPQHPNWPPAWASPSDRGYSARCSSQLMSTTTASKNTVTGPARRMGAWRRQTDTGREARRCYRGGLRETAEAAAQAAAAFNYDARGYDSRTAGSCPFLVSPRAAAMADRDDRDCQCEFNPRPEFRLASARFRQSAFVLAALSPLQK